ncbi:hypothetical protein [Halobaculum gomorrense]|uniref:Uncharacterized protein n=1 Tax=Halobaculum gomorrense TaxID=43928 RepID=A0A1M5UFI0_9EURY|nr:hypothetical protein [Halobaculum gomorrense]SHH61690.1 hypothetical protein SAMN05443636_3016 [Halobaculum gomorrense]
MHVRETTPAPIAVHTILSTISRRCALTHSPSEQGVHDSRERPSHIEERASGTPSPPDDGRTSVRSSLMQTSFPTVGSETGIECDPARQTPTVSESARDGDVPAEGVTSSIARAASYRLLAVLSLLTVVSTSVDVSGLAAMDPTEVLTDALVTIASVTIAFVTTALAANSQLWRRRSPASRSVFSGVDR